MSRTPAELRLSVVVPCKNAAPWLPVQLAALARQRWPGGWELVVADNGSTDGSRELLAAARTAFPVPLVVVDATGRGGPGGSRNAGASAATGEGIVFTDADDEVGEGWLEAMGRALLEHRLVAARYEFHRLNADWLVAARGEHQHEGLNPYTYPPFLPHAGGAGLAVARALHAELGGFDEALPALEDTDYCWRAQLAGTALHFVPEAVVHVRYRPDLQGLFEQTARFGRYNVLLYQRYRAKGMPRLAPWLGPAKWLRLLLTAPKLLHPRTRAAWLHQLAWRWGRVVGCWKYRAWAP
jgi:GT2 family glycosyltransferase